MSTGSCLVKATVVAVVCAWVCWSSSTITKDWSQTKKS